MGKGFRLGVYRHFKGNYYNVLGVAQHTETSELLVIYEALRGNPAVYARPIEMFLSDVDKEMYPDVKQKKRFEFVGEVEE